MEEAITCIAEWAKAEGPYRMAEHIIVFLVLIRLVRNAFKIESRGKVGVISYLIKLLLRLTDRIGFVRNKKEKYLEEESTKNVEETLEKKKVKLTYDKLPEKGLPKK